MQSTQWTERLAGLADEGKSHPRPSLPDASKLELGCTSHGDGVDVALRLEGPYFSPADTSRYDTVVCLVAGTGISGAIAIAAAFNASFQKEQGSGKEGGRFDTASRWRRCVIVWSVREADDIDSPFIQPMIEGLELRKFLTGCGRERVELGGELGKIVKGGGRTWVYISGPSPFINAGKAACQAAQCLANVDYYAASWDI